MSGWNASPGTGKALYPFAAQTDGQLSLTAGDLVIITQEAGGWYRGYPQSSVPPHKVKIFPSAYVQFTPDAEPAKPAVSADFAIKQLMAAATAAEKTASTEAASKEAIAKEAAAKEAAIQEAAAKEAAIKEAAAKEAAAKEAAIKEAAEKEANAKDAAAKEAAAKEAAAMDAIAKESITKETEIEAKSESPIHRTSVPSLVVSPSAQCSSTFFSPVSSPRPTPNKSTKKSSNSVKVENQDLWLPAVEVDTRESSVLDGFFSLGIDTDEGVLGATIANKNIVDLVDGYRLIDQPIGVNSAGLETDSSFLRLMQAQASVAKDQDSLGTVGVFNGAEGIFLESDGSEASRKYHLFLDVKVCIFSVSEETELLFSLYSLRKNQFITEDFVINLPPPGHQDHTKILGKMKTVFRDLDPADFQSEIHLVCRIFRKGSLIYNDKVVKDPSELATRRSFGCAVANITSANLTAPANIGREYEPPPANLSIYSLDEIAPASEFNFYRIHEMMFNPREKSSLVLAPKAKGIALAMTVFEGEYANVKKGQNAKLSGVCETPKLSFPTIWDPSVSRNDLYLTLLDGSFSQDKKTSARNIEVRVRLLNDSDYSAISDVIYRGAGEGPLPEYRSSVLYHNNTPTYNEMMKMCISPEKLQTCHLFFEFWHVSTTLKKSSPFSCAFFQLTPNSANSSIFGVTHTVTTYKPFGKGDLYLHDASKLSASNARKETFRFSLSLNSTSMTQNLTMCKISEWQTLDKPFLQSSLMSYLLKSSVSNTAEVAKYMCVLFDSLFGILSSNSHLDTHMYAFNAIAHTIARLTPTYQRVIVAYVKDCFQDTETYGRLLPLLTQTMNQQIEMYTNRINASITTTDGGIGNNADVPSVRGRNSISSHSVTGESTFQISNSSLFNNAIAAANTVNSPSVASSSSYSTGNPAHISTSGAYSAYTGSGAAGTSNSSTPTASGYSTPSATSPSSTVMRPNQNSRLTTTTYVDNSASNTSTPNSSSNFSNSTLRSSNTNTKMPAFNEDEEDVATSDIPEVLRFARSFAPLFTIIIKSYMESEKKERPVVTAPSTPAGFRALPPISSTSNSPAPITASSRTEFKNHLLDLLATVGRFVALNVPNTKAFYALAASQEHLIQQFSDIIQWLSHVFDSNEVSNIVSTFISNIPVTSSTSMYVLGLIRSIITGSDAAPAISVPPKELAETEITARSANTISSLPRLIETSLKASRRVLESKLFDSIAPTIIPVLRQYLKLGVTTHSLSECYSTLVLLQLLYTRITNASIYQGHRFASEDPEIRDGQSTNLQINILLPILPELISTVHMLQVYSPDSALSPTQFSQQTQFDDLCTASALGLQYPSVFELRSAFIDPLVDSTTILVGILQAVSDEDLQAFFDTLSKEERETTITRLLLLGSNLIDKPIFPPRWVYMHMLPLVTIVRVLKCLEKVIQKYFVGPNYSSVLWVSWLQLALSVRQTEYLDIGNMNSSRASFVKKNFGDARQGVIEIFESMWSALTDEQRVSTCSLLVEKLLLLMTISSGAFASFGMNVYYDLLCAQFRSAGDFSEVERFSIDALYEIANTSADAGSKCMSVLQSSLKERFSNDKNQDMAVAGAEFLDHVSTMFSLMASLLQFPNVPEYEDDRTSVALRLLNYIERTDHSSHSANTRKAMHTRYIQYLVNLHVDAGNFVEAAITRLQQAKVFDWANTHIEAFDKFPAEPERIRKERLIRAAIESFVRGEDWERAVDRLDYLRHYYQHIVYDYRSLAHTLAQQAEYFSKSQASSRFYYKYFRVCFYGKFDDPTLAQDCEFVYKGVKLENIMEFTGRIKRRYPNANFVMSSDKPSDEVLAKSDQTICIAVLNIPDYETRHEIVKKCSSNVRTNDHFFEQFPGTSTSLVISSQSEALSASDSLVPIPAHVTRHRDNDSIRVFEYSKPWRRTLEKNPANEFKDLWLIRSFCVVSEPFPSNRRRIPIISQSEQILTPIMHAIESIEKKTADLRSIAASVANVPFGSPAVCGPLSMTLQGIVDAAVNGGTNRYIEAFLGEDFLDASTIVHDDEREDINKTIAQRALHQDEMKAALRHQIAVVKEALVVFGEKREASLRGLEEHITQSLMVMIQQNGPLIDLV